MKKKFMFAVSLFMAFSALVSCKIGGGESEKEFTGVTFNSQSVEYDGSSHKLDLEDVVGEPEGTKIVLEGTAIEPQIEIGTYDASATLSKDGYKTKTLNATLSITEKEFKNVVFESMAVKYDGNAHILGEAKGYPEGTEVSYDGRGSFTDVGSYKATAKFEKEGYKTKTLTATLTISPDFFPEIKYESKTVTYDGTDHYGDVTIYTTQLPKGTTTDLKVTNSKGNVVTEAKNAGVYNYSLTLMNKNYTTKILTATLTINKADFGGFTYDSKTVNYDGQDHAADIQLIGTLPEGSRTTQTIKNSSGITVQQAIEPDTYSYTMVITNDNYNTQTLTATLTIKENRKDMPVFISSDGNIYFANGLDNSFLYNINSEGTIKKIDSSYPKEFKKYNSDTLNFISGSVFLNSVKKVTNGTSESIYTDSNIDDFVQQSDKIYFYSSNSITSSKSGIYKVDATDSGDEPVVTKFYEGKADNLVIYNSDLYFTNSNGYIYKKNLTSGDAVKLIEERVHEFVLYNNKLYCSVNGTLDDYIGAVDLTKSTLSIDRLTIAAGEFLTIKNNKLYFNYTDLFGVIEPSKYGIWSIDLSTKSNTQILNKNSINGFDVKSDGSIVYVDTSDLHLYQYTPSAEVTVDLLKDFVIPEEVPLNLGGKTVNYNSKLYYLNMYAGKSLWVYDPSLESNNKYQLTSNKVEDFFIFNGKLYFNQVKMFTNNDLYCVDLVSGGEAELINTNDVREMVSDGTYLYASHHDLAGAAGGLSRMKLDGTEYVKFSEINGAKNLTIRDGKLYFINCATLQDNGSIEYINLSDITPESSGLESTVLSSNIKNVKQFIFDGNNIFYIYNGTLNNSVRRTDFVTLSSGTEIASSNTNPSEIILRGDYVYYYSYASTAKSQAGFYKVRKDATGDKTYELILGYGEKYYATSLEFDNNDNLYFLNYIPKLTFGDAHFYKLNINTASVTKIS